MISTGRPHRGADAPVGRPQHSVLSTQHSHAFTLIEVLAAILILAIALPTIMGAISLCTNVAGTTRHRTQATTLAQEKLNELLVTGNWQAGTLTGDFGDRFPEFHWNASVATFSVPSGALTTTPSQLTVDVTWTSRNQPQQVELTTLIYQSASSSTGTTP